MKNVPKSIWIQLIDWWGAPMAHWCDMNSNPESNLPDSKKSEITLQQPTGTLNGSVLDFECFECFEWNPIYMNEL